jgi:hypothetical protein
LFQANWKQKVFLKTLNFTKAAYSRKLLSGPVRTCRNYNGMLQVRSTNRWTLQLRNAHPKNHPNLEGRQMQRSMEMLEGGWACN